MKDAKLTKINELAATGSRVVFQIEALMLLLQTVDTEAAVELLGGDRFAETIPFIGEIGEKLARELSDAFSLIQNEAYQPPEAKENEK